MSEKTESLEVINKDQADLIDQSKALLAAHATAEKSTHVYLFALGARLHALKATCEHGGFEKLKAAHFPSEARSTLGLALTFSDAVQYLGKGKYPTIGYLGQGELQLSNGVLPEKDRVKAAEELEQITKGRGISGTIKTFFKKTAPKPEPMDSVKQEEDHQKTLNQSGLDAICALDWIFHWKEADFSLIDREVQNGLAARCVRYGKMLRALRKAQRSLKAKARK